MIKLELLPMYSDDAKSDKGVSQKLETYYPQDENVKNDMEDDDIDEILDKLEVIRDIPHEEEIEINQEQPKSSYVIDLEEAEKLRKNNKKKKGVRRKQQHQKPLVESEEADITNG